MSTYNSPVDVQAATLVRSSNINDLDAATANAFALLPDETLLKQGKVMYAADTGTANTYLAELPASPVGYVDGLALTFKASNANTGACTINVNALGVKSIARENGTDLVSGDIVAGQMCTIRYSTTSGKFQLEGTSAPASAAAAALSAAAAASSATTATNGAGTATAKANEAANSAAAAVAAQANSTNPTFQNVSVGNGSAKSTVWINGKDAGSDGGASLIIQNRVGSVVAIGNKSALIGGGYNGTPMLWGVSPIEVNQPINIDGVVTAKGVVATSTSGGAIASFSQATRGMQAAVTVATTGGTTNRSLTMVANDNEFAPYGVFVPNSAGLYAVGNMAFMSDSSGIFTWGNPGERMRLDASGNLTPAADNAQDCGMPSKRWKVYYGVTGAINTSDEREKTPVVKLTASEIAAAKDLGKEIGSYKWLTSVQEKGTDARLHLGMTVQRAIEIMESHGLEPFKYGFICYDKWDEVIGQKRINPDEFITKLRVTTRQVQKIVISNEEVQEVQMIDGTPTLVTITRQVENTVFEELPVLNGDGSPVMIQVDETTLVPMTHKVPVMETIESQETYTVPAEPKYETVTTTEAGDRYAFRYDQLNLFIAAGFEARLSALEAA